MSGYAPRATEDSLRPRRWVGASERPLNFSVRRPPAPYASSWYSSRCGRHAPKVMRSATEFRYLAGAIASSFGQG